MLAPMLRELHFASNSGKLVPGLIATSDDETSVKRLDERLALRDAKAIGDVDYVFFRRFSDERSSQVVAYVVDNSTNRLTEFQLAELHKRVWLHGGVPLIYVAWATKVDILTCARGPDFWLDGEYGYNPAERILEVVGHAGTIHEELEARYSAWRLTDGTFWDDPKNSRLTKSKQRAHERLIQAVVETDEELNGGENPLLRRLLLLTVLIKYLEDRSVFPKGWFGHFCRGAKTFFDVLREGDPKATIRLLRSLERRFNGDIFSLPGNTASGMKKKVLLHFAKLVEAKTYNHQRYLWEQYSFEHIPVEIVSHLYQRFVKGGHGQVYTPPFLASLVLDHAMPYQELKGNERVLDPACGSGVFLVGAFRRLVNVARTKKNWDSADVEALKCIAKEQIFGAELDTDAVDLTSFSLALAICDVLKPQVIWSKLKFERLRGTNLVEGDFFSEITKIKNGEESPLSGGFDIILGNPPFESKLTDCGKELNESVSELRGDLPDNQAAYLFLEQGIEQLKPKGRLCLIQPSGILHNRKAFSFRQRIFQSAAIETVLDFTSIRALYKAADTKTVAIMAKGQKPTRDHRVTHLTFRRTLGVHERIVFELDHYDWHSVVQHQAEDNPFIWRLNLLGGGRLVGLSKRLRKLPTLGAFAERASFRFWEGYIIGKKNRRPNDFLPGMRMLNPDGLTEDGIDRKQIEVLEEKEFKSTPPESAYHAPVILIKKNELLQNDFWDDGKLAYSSTIVGLGTSSSRVDELKAVFKKFRQRIKTFRLSCMMHGSKAFVTKSTAILKQDIDAIPFPDDDRKLDLTFWEQIVEDDTLNYFAQFVRQGQNSALLKQAASKEHLDLYSETFCKLLGSVYENIASDDPIYLEGLICQPFYFGERPEQKSLGKITGNNLRKLIFHKHHESLRTVRMLRVYSDNMMLIVKPDRLRFWIPSTAIRDADETIVALVDQGY